jgi:hypothetical protein
LGGFPLTYPDGSRGVESHYKDGKEISTATRSNPLTRREVDRLGRLQVAYFIKSHPTLTPPRGRR